MVDGASGWHQFRYITLPLMKPFINIAIVLNVIYVFNSLPDHLGDDRGRPRERDRHPRDLPLQARLPLRAARQGRGDLADHVRRAAALHDDLCLRSSAGTRRTPRPKRDKHEPQAPPQHHLLGDPVAARGGDPVPLRGDVRHRDPPARGAVRLPADLGLQRIPLGELRRDVGEDELRRRAAEQPLRQHHGHARSRSCCRSPRPTPCRATASRARAPTARSC